jgi:elongation factor 1-delta
MATVTLATAALAKEKVWFDKPSYDRAERQYFEKMAKWMQGVQQSTCPILPAVGSLANEVAKARQHIKQSLQCMDDIAVLAHIANQDVTPRVVKLEKENQDLRNTIEDLKSSFEKLMQHVKSFETLEQRVERLEVRMPYLAICPAKPKESLDPEQESEHNKHQKQSKEKDDDNEDIDLFGSDSEGEDAEAAKIREERLAEYAAKKSKKTSFNSQIKHYFGCETMG